ncbi:hypothetical protein EDD18DRAFT_1101017 [Armillaria luteobubalina]|uniref:Uncharacterized protein n=1 Tax=Armillaria luteobubalina TaxID=153913 RepID=A0AA39QGR1_9AGAR|nr:hypothetical protein EDD18DRAFT_1101017 [Armillaria luteobubalina]
MHAVEHLTLRISHLHDIIHYPSPEDLHQQLTDLKQQMEKKEHALAKVQWRMDVGDVLGNRMMIARSSIYTKCILYILNLKQSLHFTITKYIRKQKGYPSQI